MWQYEHIVPKPEEITRRSIYKMQQPFKYKIKQNKTTIVHII